MSRGTDRRRFLLLWLSTALFVGVSADAHAQGRAAARIGFLGNSDPKTGAKLVPAFRQGLRELGWVEGQTITIEYRWAEGEDARLPTLVAELIRLKSDVIVVSGVTAARTAKSATKDIPIIVAAILTDPVGLGFVASLGRPGGNMTGLASIPPSLLAQADQVIE